MRKKYEQVTSALSYLTKHLYLEYKEFSKLTSKKKNIQFGKQVEQILHQRGYIDGKCKHEKIFNTISHSVQLLSRVWLCDPIDRSTPGLPVHHQLLEFTQTHVHRISDAIQPSHPLSSPSPPTFNLSQHQGLFKKLKPRYDTITSLLEWLKYPWQ